MDIQELSEKAQCMLSEGSSFLLSTIDRNGFPGMIVVSAPIIRHGMYSLKFYIDGEGETAQNVENNSMGSVCCFKEEAKESLLLKGCFTIHEIEDYKVIEDKLAEYQKELNHKYPVIISFETLAVKIHSGRQTRAAELDE
ncbi:hypothetical protein IW492_01745 [Enterococcus sp. BWB1-3]|uniref:hypothetical protein n=1 Tax=Enterococcus sp. BWB1-3 TaxID=2787713 RepID=UPI0019218101|nr:hypothetical protein [Enterococcus sp. BWB1-3]MBL1227951.1 hypothetical protein [Enterococcus sp. BWB1-3]